MGFQSLKHVSILFLFVATFVVESSANYLYGRESSPSGISETVKESTELYIPLKEFTFDAVIKGIEENVLVQPVVYINGKLYNFKKDDTHSFEQRRLLITIKHLPLIITSSDHIELKIELQNINDGSELWGTVSDLPYKMQKMNIVCIGEPGSPSDEIMYQCVNNDVHEFSSTLAKIGEKYFDIDSLTSINSSSVYVNRTLDSLNTGKYLNDTYVLYLSGHGSGNDKGEHYEYYFHCSDYDDALNDKVAVNEEDIFNFATSLARSGNKVWLFIDTCFSGYLANYFDNKSTKLNEFGQGGIGIFTSTPTGTKDYQLARTDDNNSKFTKDLLSAMNKSKGWVSTETFKEAIKKDYYASREYGCFKNKGSDAPFLSSNKIDIISAKKYPFSINAISSLEMQYYQLYAGYSIDRDSFFSGSHLSIGIRIFPINNAFVIPNLNKDIYFIGLWGNHISPCIGYGYNFGACKASLSLAYQYAVCEGNTIEYTEDGQVLQKTNPFRILGISNSAIIEKEPSIKAGILSISPSLSFNLNYFTRIRFIKRMSVIVGYDFFWDTGNKYLYRDLNSSLNQNWHMGLGYNFSINN